MFLIFTYMEGTPLDRSAAHHATTVHVSEGDYLYLRWKCAHVLGINYLKIELARVAVLNG